MTRDRLGGRLLAAAAIVAFSISLAAQDALTNRDVVRLVAVGLSESNIIRTIHAVGLNDFDLSKGGMALLREARVPERVILAMRQQARVDAGLAPTQEGEEAVWDSLSQQQEPLTLFKVELKTAQRRIRLHYTQPGIGRSFLSGGLLAFQGGQAKSRAPAGQSTFEVTLPADMNPVTFVALARLKARSNSRAIDDSPYTASGVDKKRLVDIRLKTIREADNMVLYQVEPIEPLEPGEYLLIVSGSYYDFGLD